LAAAFANTSDHIRMLRHCTCTYIATGPSPHEMWTEKKMMNTTCAKEFGRRRDPPAPAQGRTRIALAMGMPMDRKPHERDD